jgi:hypothetical protein
MVLSLRCVRLRPTRAMTSKIAGRILLVLVWAWSAAPAVAQSGRSSLEGLWSNPPSTAVGTFCAFYCTDAGIDRLNALLDDPANDSIPYQRLRGMAQQHELDTYIRPRLTLDALRTYPLDPADDPGLLRCEPWGLARQMFAPHQLEIRRLGNDRIELHYGEWDARRTVYMNGRPRPANQPPIRLGYSVGRWEGETLVVETSGVTKNSTGWSAEHSDQLHVIERFARSAKDNTLLLTATFDDPWSLREPLVLKKVWTWSPKSEITPYDACQPVTAVKKRERPQ